jgi:ribonuclease HI
MMLRGQTVFVRCDERGEPLAEKGRVEVRYRPKDGRAYRAGLGNLMPLADATLFPDDLCGPAEQAAAKSTKATGKTAAKTSRRVESARETPAENEVIAYADGACSGNPGPAGLGVVLVDGRGRRELSEYLGRTTNNVAELTAILRVAQAVDDASRVVNVYTDSAYSIGVLTKGWKAKANRELVAVVKEALARLPEIRLHHVPGHAGVPLNERADELARMAVKSANTSGWQSIG